jgi:hypothetical protein
MIPIITSVNNTKELTFTNMCSIFFSCYLVMNPGLFFIFFFFVFRSKLFSDLEKIVS